MQPQVHAFVATAAESFEFRSPVYEFSYCPGLTERSNGNSHATDEAELDRLEQLEYLPFPDGAAQTVLSIDAIEHASNPQQAANELIRLLAPGGMLLIASTAEASPPATGRHRQSAPGAIERLMCSLDATLIGWQGAEQSPHTVFGIGFKAPSPERFLGNANQFMRWLHDRMTAASRAGWWHRLCQLAAALASSREERMRIRDFYKTQFMVHAPIRAESRHDVLSACLPDQPTGSRLDLKL